MVTKDYSKSRMRENRTYGSVRGGQSNLIPSTRLTAALPLRVVVGACGANMKKPLKPGFAREKTGKPPLRAGEMRSPLPASRDFS